MVASQLKKLWIRLLKNGILRFKNNSYKYIAIDDFKPLIHWQNFGSSAEKLDFESFKWLINTIYKEYSYNDFV